MALPKNVDTPLGRHLHAVLAAASVDEFSVWPMLKMEDYLAIGAIVALFGYIDYNLRRLVEGYDDAGLLQPPGKDRSKTMNMAEIESAARTMLSWPRENAAALERITELRGLRNLVTHFAIRRFPNDDAFVFIGKSARDHKRHFGDEPKADVSVTAVLEGPALAGVVPELEGLQNWLAGVTADMERQFFHLIPNSKLSKT